MPARCQSRLLTIALVAIGYLATPAHAFGAGWVSRGSGLKGVNFRHGDIATAIYFLATARPLLLRRIYFGNWMRDFNQILDAKAITLVPEPILRALVGVLSFVQFGYATREFEVTDERLGKYRPEEHIDNPKGYSGGLLPGLRQDVQPPELEIDPETGMKNYIANRQYSHFTPTSYEYVYGQLEAAVACARERDPEAYIYLGAAMHTLEDFLAHSNWVELCMQMIGRGLADTTSISPSMTNVFAFVGDGASIETKRGRAPPLVTGTFGALDLYQTLLGEIDDKITALSIPGLQLRMPDAGGPLKELAASLTSSLNGAGAGSFEKDISKITSSASSNDPANWGELMEAPERLWEAIEPVFRFRDDVVKWVDEHLKIRAVQDALATISTALDKLVYRILGIFLGPVLKDISAALQKQEEQLLFQDEQSRLASGELSIFDDSSKDTDPTHSQLCKDHYDNDLNELAGRVATTVSKYAVRKIIEVWQPGMTSDIRPTLTNILESLHHPYNSSTSSEIQTLMFAQVFEYCSVQSKADPKRFEGFVQSLDKTHMAAKLGEQGHTHSHSRTNAYAPPTAIGSTHAHALTTVQPERVETTFVQRISDNLEHSMKEGGGIPGLSLDDLPGIKDLLSATPSADAPNPIDHALRSAGGGVGLTKAFKDIQLHEILGAAGMGNVLKDGLINMLLNDPERLEVEAKAARERLGAQDDLPAQDLIKLLDFDPVFKPKKEGGRSSAGRKVLDAMNKLKIKS